MSEQQAAAQQTESRQWSSEIKELGEKIMSLTLLQAKELGDYLRIEHGIEPAAGAVAVAAAAPAGGAAPAEEEKTDFDVILKSVGDKKIQVIKVVRQVLPGLGLKEAKDLVESAPKPIKEGVPKEEAEQIKKQLEEAGAVVEIS